MSQQKSPLTNYIGTQYLLCSYIRNNTTDTLTTTTTTSTTNIDAQYGVYGVVGVVGFLTHGMFLASRRKKTSRSTDRWSWAAWRRLWLAASIVCYCLYDVNGAMEILSTIRRLALLHVYSTAIPVRLQLSDSTRCRRRSLTAPCSRQAFATVDQLQSMLTTPEYSVLRTTATTIIYMTTTTTTEQPTRFGRSNCSYLLLSRAVLRFKTIVVSK